MSRFVGRADRVKSTISVAGCGLVFAAALAVSSPARAETIKARDMLRGTESTPEACGPLRNAVWVMAYGHGFCMRYYISNAGGSDDTPTVYLSGDKPTFDTLHENVRSGKHRSSASKNLGQERRAQDVDTAELDDKARQFSQRTGTTAIVLGRMGLDGSSGHHGLRRTMLELRATNAALDAIKQRHGYRGFHLFGNSGGSTLIGGLLALRGDIGCAVPGSGRLALLTQAKKVDAPELERFDPVKMIPSILQNSSRSRIIVLTDPQDKIVPSQNQSEFVERYQAAGGRIERFFVTSTDESNHHGLKAYSALVMRQCVRNASHQEIKRKLDEFAERRLDRAEKK